jgi:hypothetical protein
MMALIATSVEWLLFGYVPGGGTSADGGSVVVSAEAYYAKSLNDAFRLVCQLMVNVYGLHWLQLAVTKALIDYRMRYRYAHF